MLSPFQKTFPFQHKALCIIPGRARAKAKTATARVRPTMHESGFSVYFPLFSLSIKHFIAFSPGNDLGLADAVSSG